MQISGASSSYYLQQLQQSLFSKADTDESGTISLDEFEAGNSDKSAASANSAGTKKAEELFSSIDTSGDGELSDEEFSAFFNKLSSETAGAMIPFQMGGPQGGPPPGGGHDPMQDLIGTADEDGDGVLALDEFVAAGPDDAAGSGKSEELFASIDTDGDGSVTQDELDSFSEQRGLKGAGGMPPPPPQMSGAKESDDTEETSLADILASLSEDDEDDATSSTSSSIIDQLNAYAKQMYSAYADQTQSAVTAADLFV